MIVVTGATGHVGGLVAEELAARGEPIACSCATPRARPRSPARRSSRRTTAPRAALAAALHEGDRVFMVSLHEGPEQRVPLHRTFIAGGGAARRRAGRLPLVRQRGPDALFLHARSHGATERMLAASGVPLTSIRNSMYADDIPGWFDADGVLRDPGGDAR